MRRYWFTCFNLNTKAAKRNGKEYEKKSFEKQEGLFLLVLGFLFLFSIRYYRKVKK